MGRDHSRRACGVPLGMRTRPAELAATRWMMVRRCGVTDEEAGLTS